MPIECSCVLDIPLTKGLCFVDVKSLINYDFLKVNTSLSTVIEVLCPAKKRHFYCTTKPATIWQFFNLHTEVSHPCLPHLTFFVATLSQSYSCSVFGCEVTGERCGDLFIHPPPLHPPPPKKKNKKKIIQPRNICENCVFPSEYG